MTTAAPRDPASPSVGSPARSRRARPLHSAEWFSRLQSEADARVVFVSDRIASGSPRTLLASYKRLKSLDRLKSIAEPAGNWTAVASRSFVSLIPPLLDGGAKITTARSTQRLHTRGERVTLGNQLHRRRHFLGFRHAQSPLAGGALPRCPSSLSRTIGPVNKGIAA